MVYLVVIPIEFKQILSVNASEAAPTNGSFELASVDISIVVDPQGATVPVKVFPKSPSMSTGTSGKLDTSW